MSVHLTPACLKYLHSDVSAPAVSIPTSGSASRVGTFSLANGRMSEIAVISAIAKRLQWNSVAFLTDEAGSKPADQNPESGEQLETF